MTIKKLKDKDSKLLVVGTLVVTIFMQLLVVPRLPEKYFYDSAGILNVANGNYDQLQYDKSYIFAGNFYKTINIFGLSTFSQWATIITIVASIIITLFLLKYRGKKILGILFVYSTVAFANIYLFRISKDFIQLLFFAACYLSIKGQKQKFFVSIMILMLEGLLFRTYYIGIALLSIAIYGIISKQSNMGAKKKALILIIIGMGAILLLYLTSPANFNYLSNIRTNTNQYRLSSPDAITIINNVLPGNNFLVFICNYVINITRILFPIELAFKGIKYLSFILYQAFFALSVYKKTKMSIANKDKHYYPYIAIIASFLLVSSVFEPDFGSLIRHEISMFPIVIPFLMGKRKENADGKNN